jgi:hypothetical protein
LPIAVEKLETSSGGGCLLVENPVENLRNGSQTAFYVDGLTEYPLGKFHAESVIHRKSVNRAHFGGFSTTLSTGLNQQKREGRRMNTRFWRYQTEKIASEEDLVGDRCP